METAHLPGLIYWVLKNQKSCGIDSHPYNEIKWLKLIFLISAHFKKGKTIHKKGTEVPFSIFKITWVNSATGQ